MTKKDEQEIAEIDSLKEPTSLGKIFFESGMFPDIKSQSMAVVKIMAGAEMGLTPFESMNSLYIVNGKIAVMANALASIIKKNPKYDYIVDTLTDKECSIEFFQVNGDRISLGKSTFTFQDGAKAGLVNKDVWKNYPRNMLFARALSNGVKWFCADASCGYSVEEMKDITVGNLPEKSKTILDTVLVTLKEKYPDLEKRKEFLTGEQIVNVKDLDKNTLSTLLEVLNGKDIS